MRGRKGAVLLGREFVAPSLMAVLATSPGAPARRHAVASDPKNSSRL